MLAIPCCLVFWLGNNSESLIFQETIPLAVSEIIYLPGQAAGEMTTIAGNHFFGCRFRELYFQWTTRTGIEISRTAPMLPRNVYTWSICTMKRTMTYLAHTHFARCVRLKNPSVSNLAIFLRQVGKSVRFQHRNSLRSANNGEFKYKIQFNTHPTSQPQWLYLMLST